MKLPEKIMQLRKSNGWSQEDLAEKLNVSRQAISRWEGATAQPDAANILQLSKLFGVTTDYLLKDEDTSGQGSPKAKEGKRGGIQQIMIFMIALEGMVWIIQFIATFILQNMILGMLGCLPFVAILGGFEYSYQKRKGEADENAQASRKKFYKISAWVGTGFPIRSIVRALSSLYPRPYPTVALEGVALVLYLMTAALICLQIEKSGKK